MVSPPVLAPNMPWRSPMTTGSGEVPGAAGRLSDSAAVAAPPVSWACVGLTFCSAVAPTLPSGAAAFASSAGGFLGPASLDASNPFIACVGVAFMAASSAARAAVTRLTPSGVFWICWCSVMIALSSISGRGGQPGR